MDERFHEAALEDYVKAVASGAPSPGGGSVAGLVGALGASLGCMVSNMTIAKARTPVAPELTAALESLDRVSARLLDLSQEDAGAYAAYIAATRLPKSTDDEKAARKAAQQSALHHAADVPLATATACREVLEHLGPVAAHGTRHALADCAVGAWLAVAAAQAGLINVRVNADMMTDAERQHAYRERVDVIEADLETRKEAILAEVSRRSA